MKVSISIEDQMVKDFSPNAIKELTTQVQLHSESLINEVLLLEEGARIEGSQSEITQSMVKQAATINKIAPQKRVSNLFLFFNFVSYVLTLIAGAMISEVIFGDNSSRTHWFYLFLVIVLLCAGGLDVYMFINKKQ